MASDTTIATLRADLEGSAAEGAGLLELLVRLQESNRRLSRRERLSRTQFEELSLLCWSLRTHRPNGLVPERADRLWRGLRVKRRSAARERGHHRT